MTKIFSVLVSMIISAPDLWVHYGYKVGLVDLLLGLDSPDRGALCGGMVKSL